MSEEDPKQIEKEYKELPFEVTMEGEEATVDISPDKMEDLREILGVRTNGAIMKRMFQLSIAAPKLPKGKGADPQGLGKACREMQEMGPRDATESQIMAEMIAMNDAYFELIGYFHNHELDWKYRQQALAEASKISRTYQSLVNTLRQWRTQGTQVVKHVHVNEGGQAAFIEQYTRGGVENGVKNE